MFSERIGFFRLRLYGCNNNNLVSLCSLDFFDAAGISAQAFQAGRTWNWFSVQKILRDTADRRKMDGFCTYSCQEINNTCIQECLYKLYTKTY